MVRDDLVEALVDQCLKELANDQNGGQVLTRHAADWFCDNVKDQQISDFEWATLLCAFTEKLKVSGALLGH